MTDTTYTASWARAPARPASAVLAAAGLMFLGSAGAQQWAEHWLAAPGVKTRAAWCAVAGVIGAATFIPAALAASLAWQAGTMTGTLPPRATREWPARAFLIAACVALAGASLGSPWGVGIVALAGLAVGGAIPLVAVRPLVALRAFARFRGRGQRGVRTLEGVARAVGGTISAPISGRGALAAVGEVWFMPMPGAQAIARQVAHEARSSPAVLECAGGPYDLALDGAAIVTPDESSDTPRIDSPMLAPRLASAGVTDRAKLLGVERLVRDGDVIAVIARVRDRTLEAVAVAVDPRGVALRGVRVRAWSALALGAVAGSAAGRAVAGALRHLHH